MNADLPDKATGGDDEDPPPFTIDELIGQGDAAKRDWRTLPRLVRSSLAMAWQAGRRELLVTAVLDLCTGLLAAAQLLVGKQVLDAVLAARPAAGGLGRLLPPLAALVAATLLQRFAAAAQREQQEILTELVNRHAQGRVLDVAGSVDLLAFESPSFYNRLQRAEMGAGMRPMQMVQGLLGLAQAVATMAGMVAALVTLQPLLLPILLGALLPLWYVTRRNSMDTFRFFIGMTPLERLRRYLGGLLSQRASAKEVRAFQLAGYLRERWERLWDERLAELRDTSRRRLRRSLLAGLSSVLLTTVALGVLTWLYVSGRMDLAATGASAAALLQLSGALSNAGFSVGMLYEASLFIDDYQAFLRLAPSAAPARAPGPVVPAPAFSEVAAESVSFSYPQAPRPALVDVSLRVGAGEVVALVGENGSGKTTLAKLLAQLYRPDRGRVLWGGVDTATLDPAELRRDVTVIFQDFVQYVLSAAENVGLGRHERLHDREGIRAAGRLADVDEVLERLPEGYATLLGNEFVGGRDLSKGQWQRVALARAFFRDAPFIVLDEPTAALDARAEHDLFERVRDLFRGRAVLLISHRFSSVRSADRIYVLSEGRVVEHGSHDDLLAGGGLYAELFTLQAAAYRGDGADGDGQPARLGHT
jgi:ATP-binding cassette, subfamily B, bacterial